MPEYEYVGDGRPDGTIVGRASTEKVGFWGTAPITQPTNSAQAALTLLTAISANFLFLNFSCF